MLSKEEQILKAAFKESVYWSPFRPLGFRTSVNGDKITEQFSKFLDKKSNSGELLTLTANITKEEELNTNLKTLLDVIVADKAINKLMAWEQAKIDRRIYNLQEPHMTHSDEFRGMSYSDFDVDRKIDYLRKLNNDPIQLLELISKRTSTTLSEKAIVDGFLTDSKKILNEITTLKKEKATFVKNTVFAFTNTHEYKSILEKNTVDREVDLDIGFIEVEIKSNILSKKVSGEVSESLINSIKTKQMSPEKRRDEFIQSLKNINNHLANITAILGHESKWSLQDCSMGNKKIIVSLCKQVSRQCMEDIKNKQLRDQKVIEIYSETAILAHSLGICEDFTAVYYGPDGSALRRTTTNQHDLSKDTQLITPLEKNTVDREVDLNIRLIEAEIKSNILSKQVSGNVSASLINSIKTKQMSPEKRRDEFIQSLKNINNYIANITAIPELNDKLSAKNRIVDRGIIVSLCVHVNRQYMEDVKNKQLRDPKVIEIYSKTAILAHSLGIYLGPRGLTAVYGPDGSVLSRTPTNQHDLSKDTQLITPTDEPHKSVYNDPYDLTTPSKSPTMIFNDPYDLPKNTPRAEDTTPTTPKGRHSPRNL